MRIASISKALTMTAVARLVEEGKIDLDKTVKEYLGDEWPDKHPEITVRQVRELAVSGLSTPIVLSV